MADQQRHDSSISSLLLGHVLFTYCTILEFTIQSELTQTETVHNLITREGINIIAENDAPAAYILAVASVEASVNEVFFGHMVPYLIKGTPLENISESLERIDICTKLILAPQLAFNITFQKDEQPFQDMVMLVKVRNDFVHYKMEPGEPKYLKTLQNRRIALNWPNIPWAFALSTSEGIRWAHNTACLTIHKLNDFIPDQYRSMLSSYIQDFTPISETEIIARFTNNKIDI